MSRDTFECSPSESSQHGKACTKSACSLPHAHQHQPAEQDGQPQASGPTDPSTRTSGTCSHHETAPDGEASSRPSETHGASPKGEYQAACAAGNATSVTGDRRQRTGAEQKSLRHDLDSMGSAHGDHRSRIRGRRRMDSQRSRSTATATRLVTEGTAIARGAQHL